MEIDASLVLVLSTLVFPTCAWIVLRMQGAALTREQEWAAWCCLWTGQLVVPVTVAAWLSVAIVSQPDPAGTIAAALLYGMGGSAVAMLTAIQTVRALAVGSAILRLRPPQAIHDRARRGGASCLRALVGAVGLYVLMFYIPVPGGRWAPILYLIGVITPVLMTALLVLTALTFARAALDRP